jgi:hypothetical protein
MADVEMKSSADTKPVEEEKKKVEEPADKFYGKSPELKSS